MGYISRAAPRQSLGIGNPPRRCPPRCRHAAPRGCHPRHRPVQSGMRCPTGRSFWEGRHHECAAACCGAGSWRPASRTHHLVGSDHSLYHMQQHKRVLQTTPSHVYSFAHLCLLHVPYAARKHKNSSGSHNQLSPDMLMVADGPKSSEGWVSTRPSEVSGRHLL